MKKLIIVLLLVVIGLGGWFGWTHRGVPTEASPEPAVTATVEVAPLAMQEIAETREAFGVVGAAPSGEQVAVARFDGMVRRVVVAPGVRVAAGDVLVELALAPDGELALASARGAAALAEQTRADAQRRYDLRLATRIELLAAQQAAQDAQMKVASLEARGAGGDGCVRATTAGVVSKLDATAGSWVSAGAALVTITGEAAMEVRLGVEAADAARVAAGQNVALASTSRPEAETGVTTVREVGRVVDPVTGAVEVRAAVPPGGLWLVGEHVRATIELRRKTTLVAPRRALLPEEDHQVLFTVKAGKAVRHEVQPGLTAGDWVEVGGADLHAGDVVVTLGNYELEDGMAVQTGGSADAAQAAGKPNGEASHP